MKKLIALVLCVLMLFSLAACSGESPAPTPEPVSTPEPSPEADPVEEALEGYDKALAALADADRLSLAVESSTVRSVGSQSYAESLKETIIYQDMLSDSPIILRDQHFDYFGKDTYVEYYYADGWAIIDGTYKAEISLEDFEESLYPTALIDPALYEDISLSGSILSFASPTAPEAWLGEDIELLKASGSVELSGESISSFSFETRYILNSVTVDYSLSISFAEPDTARDLWAEKPGLTGLKPLSDMRIPEMYNRAELAARGSTAQTTALSNTYQVQAGGLYFSDVLTMDVIGAGAELEMMIEENQTIIENGQSFTYEITSSYVDGVYRSTTNGELYEQIMPATDLDTYGVAYSYVLPIRNLDGITLKELDGYYLLEFAANPALGEGYQADICQMFYGDPEILTSIATGYATNKFDGFLALDADSLLPTGYGLSYEGVHTIYGMENLISHDVGMSFDMLSNSAYEAVTGEAPQEAEPENKATPLFYKVSGENGQSMWLMGTIHVGDERTAYLPESVYKALDNSDALAVEVDTNGLEEYLEENPDVAQTIGAMYYFSDGSKIEDNIDPELYAEAWDMLRAVGGYQYGVNMLKPMLWSTTIENAFMTHAGQLSSDKGVDMRLMKLAEDKNIEVREVESVESQLGMLYGFDTELQELILSSTLYGGRKAYAESVMELYELWCAGDEAALTETLRAESELEFTEEEDLEKYTEEDIARLEALMADYEKAMGPDRDAAMIETAIGYLESGETVFFAVGLAHLLAESGLVDGLRAAGYTVELVG